MSKMVNQIGILSRNRAFYPTSDLLIETNRRTNINGVFLDTQKTSAYLAQNPDVLIYNYSLRSLGCIVPRIGRSQTDFGVIILKQLEILGIPTTLSSQALENSRNKFRSYQLLRSLRGVQIPKTILIQDISYFDEIIKRFKFPIVLKIVNSSQGIGTILVPSKRLAKEILASIFLSGQQSIMIQEFLAPNINQLPESRPEDIRIFVVGDEVIGAMRRVAKKGEWRTNFAQGADCFPYSPTEEEIDLSLKISNLFGIEITGIDFLHNTKGLSVLEVNACPGWKAIEQVNPGLHPAKKIIDYAIQKMKK